MNLQYLDMPYITRPTQAGFDFIYALAECENLDIFNLKSIQIIIDCHARYWDRINYLFVGFPMVINLILFWYWSNVILPNLKNDDSFESQDNIVRVFQTTTCLYLFALEISAIVKKRLEYINDTARIFNFITPILILTNVLTTEGHTEPYFWYI